MSGLPDGVGEGGLPLIKKAKSAARCRRNICWLSCLAELKPYKNRFKLPKKKNTRIWQNVF